jgi:CO/xanthine dehydrogenase Mo-binding subunit
MPTWVGCVAEVAVTSATGGVRLDKLSLCIDCGTVIHPDGALAQAEGAALWGASMALHEGTAFAAGQVSDRNLDTYTPLRMTDLPELDIAFVDSSEFPVGLGEPPMLPVAPAIGNAIYQACGARVRELPIRRAAVQNALAARGR